MDFFDELSVLHLQFNLVYIICPVDFFPQAKTICKSQLNVPVNTAAANLLKLLEINKNNKTCSIYLGEFIVSPVLEIVISSVPLKSIQITLP